MSSAGDQPHLQITERAAGELVILEGDLTHLNADEFKLRMRSIIAHRDRALTLDLSALDIDDGVAVATAINAIRELVARSRKLIIKGAPQILGHNLYRVGMLNEDAAIELVEMRLDEASGL